MPWPSRSRNDPKLSVAIVTQNRAESLRRAISSVAPMADEIVVVDGGSSDHTRAVVDSFPHARYFERDFPGSIANQKNFAIAQTGGDWVFLLDSDEMVGPNFRSGIKDWMTSRWRTHYRFPRYWLIEHDPNRYVHSDRMYPDFQLRLFRNEPFWRYEEKTDEEGRPIGPIHHHFPKRGRGSGKLLPEVHIFHFDLALNDRAARERKVKWYDAVEPGKRGTNHHFYLYEDYPHELREMEEELGLRGGNSLQMIR